MVFYLDIFKFLIRSDYRDGLRVIPIVLFSYIFQGVFFNLSLWYKLMDKTMYGAWFSVVGAVITLGINIVFVPVFSYMASAWAAFACYFVMMLLSYFIGQKNMPIPYDLKAIGLYTILSVVLFSISIFIETPWNAVDIILKTMLILIFIIVLIKRDFPLENIKFVKRFLK
jgi:O-antigen/teichoic acid export membrane protein